VRNPVRIKNLNRRFLPVLALAVVGLLAAAPTRGSIAIGLFVAACGLSLRSWGAGHLVKRDELVTSGPYAHLRHPLYAGTLLISAGLGVALGPVGWGLLAGTGAWFAGLYFPAKERRESHLLEARYGLDYVRYRARVPALLPRPRDPVFASSPPQPWRLARYSENNELGTLLGVVALAALIVFRVVVA
jgi:protein-S-isoprenylcysteine O-methyltransferase Ste14